MPLRRCHSAMSHFATVVLLAVISWLAGCSQDLGVEVRSSRVTEFGPHRQGRFGDEQSCIREARRRIKVLGKAPFESDGWGLSRRVNPDSVSGEWRSDIWVGPHLFAMPRQAGVGGGVMVAGGLPGLFSTVNLRLPYMDGHDERFVGPDPYADPRGSPVAELWISCEPHFRLAERERDMRQRAESFERRLLDNPESAVFAWDLRGIKEQAHIEYLIDVAVLSGSASGPGLLFCDRIREPRPDLDRCLVSFPYRDGVRVQLKFKAIYTEHWQQIFRNSRALLDEAYRGDGSVSAG